LEHHPSKLTVGIVTHDGTEIEIQRSPPPEPMLSGSMQDGTRRSVSRIAGLVQQSGYRRYKLGIDERLLQHDTFWNAL
jgi:hypothetical protein